MYCSAPCCIVKSLCLTNFSMSVLTESHSFSQGMKSWCWHWSLKRSTSAHKNMSPHTRNTTTVRVQKHLCTRTTKAATKRYSGERCILHTWINNPLFIDTTGSEHQHKHSSNLILPHYSLGCITDTYHRLTALWDHRQCTQSSYLSAADQY